MGAGRVAPQLSAQRGERGPTTQVADRGMRRTRSPGLASTVTPDLHPTLRYGASSGNIGWTSRPS